ncbi:hypothetical protein NU08_0912 [Flavobacterium anhuiense]|uniref:Uncharacterized protein n=2 Tax=Flavobacteriaceae TaxID=49546 RepID=A0A444W377_9FLAO|nr:hypothetical protein NU08_0912 [Flavobacterium anhuiense]
MQIIQNDSAIGAALNFDYQGGLKEKIIALQDFDDFIDGVNCDCDLIPESKDNSEHLSRIQFSENGFGCSLKWYKNKGKQYLLGRTFRKNFSNYYDYQNKYTDAYIKLEKVDKIIPSESSLIKARITATGIKKRKKEVEKLIINTLLDEDYEMVKKVIVNTKEVKLNFSDYSRVDRDRVSIYVDRKPVFLNKELLDDPFEIVLEMDKTVNCEVIFVTENLGTVLPNTAEMDIKAGKLNEKIDLTSERIKKKAVFIFKYVD